MPTLGPEEMRKCSDVANNTYDLCNHCASPLCTPPTPSNAVQTSSEADSRVTACDITRDERLEDLIEWFNMKIDTIQQCGMTTLQLAAVQGHTDTVKLLLESLAHDERLECLKAKDEHGVTAIHRASMFGYTDTLKVLLESVAPDERLECLKAKDVMGCTALQLAAVHGHTDTVKVLLESLAHDERLECLKAKDDNGMTALHGAAGWGHTDTVKVLLEILTHDERLEYLKAKDGSGMTALHWAAHNVDIINYFIQSTEPEQRLQLLSTSNHDQDTALMLMAEKNDSQDICQVLKLLTLTQRFDCMKMQGKNGQTVLHALSANRQKAEQSKLATVVSLTGRFAPELLKIKDRDSKTPVDVADTATKKLLAGSLMTYNLHKPPAVIIFYKTEDCTAVTEMKAIRNACLSSGIPPMVRRDFPGSHVLSTITNICNEKDLSGLIVITMSRGNKDAHIIDGDGQPLPIQAILQALGDGDGIPKVLIVQTYRDSALMPRSSPGLPGNNMAARSTSSSAPVSGSIDTAISSTGVSETFHINSRDVMVLFSTLPGTAATRNVFIPILAKHMEQDAIDEDLYTVVSKTKRAIRQQTNLDQVIHLRSTLSRRLCIGDFALI